ncbi:MAG: sensor histidine kinase [Ignavibacteriales bacterium]
MKWSIRTKLFLAIVGIIFCYVCLAWVANNQFLNKYYMNQKSKLLVHSFQDIYEIYTGDPDQIFLELERLDRSEGLHVMITDSEYTSIYNSFSQRANESGSSNAPPGLEDTPAFSGPQVPNIDRPPDERAVGRQLDQAALTNMKSGDYIIRQLKDRRLDTDFVTLAGKLANGDYMFLRLSVASITESVQIANNFLLFTGAITILLAIIVVFFLAKRFTRPIQELNEVANALSLLDFSRKYTGRTRDEIGELGESINSLSEQLENSIVELREANLKLQADIERERQIDDMRKEFIANVSHELKTPIALIQGYAEGLRVNVNEDEESKNFYCDVIADESKKMDRLVRQLLNLAQLEWGELNPEKEDFDIKELAVKVLKKHAPILNEKQVKVEIEGEPQLMVWADPTMMEQILINYLNNALNHTEPEGKISIKLDREGAKAVVSVFNIGQQIPEDALEQIWTSFYKVDKARTRTYGGTGLGLSVVKAIQDQHGNKCGVTNEAGGVRFWFDVDLTTFSP